MPKSYWTIYVALAFFGASGTLYAETSKNNTEKLPEVCEKMLKEASKLVTEAEKQPGTHPQVKDLKTSLANTKKNLQQLDPEMQTKSCEKGLNGLNKLKENEEQNNN